jgi:hypothetical protein
MQSVYILEGGGTLQLFFRCHIKITVINCRQDGSLNSAKDITDIPSIAIGDMYHLAI